MCERKYFLYLESSWYRKSTLKFRKESEYRPYKIVAYITIAWAETTLHFDEWKKCFKTDVHAKHVVYGDHYFVFSIWVTNNVCVMVLGWTC